MSPVQESQANPVGRLLPALGAGLLLAFLAACSSSGTSTTQAVTPPPAFTTQPADTTVVVGGPATFTALASNNPVYQWTRGGAPVAGASGPSYTLAVTAPGDDRAAFAVTAQTSGGTATSATATLHVNYVTITSHPAGLTLSPAAAATFTVAAQGSGTLGYQWAKDGAPISGATQASFTLAAPALTDSGSYACTVTSVLNGTTTSATSHAATLALAATVPTPVIQVQPAPVTVLAGASASFSVAASNGVTYQWYQNGLAIPRATDPTYTTPPTIAAYDHMVYSVAVGNGNGSVTSAGAELRVNYVLIGSQPASTTAPGGQPFNLPLAASAAGDLTCQWFKDGVAVPGATATTLAIADLGAADAGSYSCALASALNGTVATLTSNAAQLAVVGQPVITTQPLGGTYIPGDQLQLILVAKPSGLGQLGYQWYKDGVKLASQTSAILIIQTLADSDSGTYTCVVTNYRNVVSASVTSQPAVVVVRQSPIFNSQPFSTTATEGTTASFSVNATGPGTITYQWYRNGSLIPGATATGYTTPKLTLADDQSKFYCTASNGNPPDAVSSTATLTVKPLVPAFAASATTIISGQGVVFTYLFSPEGTATFGPAGGAAVPVVSGKSSTVYPTVTTTYNLNVTTSEGTVTTPVLVTVQSYTPSYFYVVNKDSNDIYQYPVNVNSPMTGTPATGVSFDDGFQVPANALIGKPLQTHVATGQGPVHMAAAPGEKFIYVANSADATISGYAADPATGILAPLAGSPYALPAGYSTPWCSGADVAGARLYVACPEGIAVLDITPATGALTANAGLSLAIAGKGQGDLLVHPSGKFLYVADSGHSILRSYAIDPATGALAPAGSDQPVTYVSGINPYLAIPLHNPTCMAIDRAGAVLFTRSTDPRMGPDNAAIDSFTIDPYTGALAKLATSQALPDANGNALVSGYSDEFHGLSFSALPGVDHLYEGYRDGIYQSYFTDWSVDMNPASATYGTVAFANNPYWGLEPHFSESFEGQVGTAGSSGVIPDRSGRVLAVPGNNGENQLYTFGSDPQGNIAWMGNWNSGETLRATGTNPVHGLFLGSVH